MSLADQVVQAMSDDEKSAALRFCETCDDSEGYDVPRPMMMRLAAHGLVIDRLFGRFEQTDMLLDIRDDLEAAGYARGLKEATGNADVDCSTCHYAAPTRHEQCSGCEQTVTVFRNHKRASWAALRGEVKPAESTNQQQGETK